MGVKNVMQDVLGLILGGGQGSRLYPLTQQRSKPAVPIAGKYRLIDIPISNCINAGIDKIAILTQFNSVSLHRHITNTYRRDKFVRGWVELLAAEQTVRGTGWYQGTADAVRQQLVEINSSNAEYVLILAGDHLYQMDYSEFVHYHIESGADITLAVQPVNAEEAPGLGILKRSPEGEIVEFKEKPKAEELDGLESVLDSPKPYMASMGIYVFSIDMLNELLKKPGNDFGKDIIPSAMSERKIMGYVFEDYWADIGTVRRFYDVNLEMASANPPFNLKDTRNPIFTRARFLPPCEVRGAKLDQVLLTDGSQIADAEISKAVIGLRSVIGSQVVIKDSIVMGADHYETEESRAKNRELGRPDIGIGEGSVIEAALIDMNVRIGKNVQIRKLPNRQDETHENWAVREGLVIVPKNATIPDDTVI